MSSDESALGAALNELLPEERSAGDWSRVLADARTQRRPIKVAFATRRRAFALAAVIIAIAAAPIAALAISHTWVFGSSLAPAAAGDIVPIRAGETAGLSWTLAGYRSTSGALCIVFLPMAQDTIPTRTPLPANSSTSCTDEQPGTSSSAAGAAKVLQFFGSTRDASGRGFAFVAGHTSDDVARVTVMLRPSGELTVEPVAAPSSLTTTGRFFATVIPNGSAAEIVALNTTGEAIAKARLTDDRPTPTTNTSTTSSSGTDFAGP